MWMSKQLTYYNLIMWVTAHKYVNDAVGHREVIHGLENIRKTDGQTERHADTNSKYEHPNSIYF